MEKNNNYAGIRDEASVLTGRETRLAYPHLFEKYAYGTTDKPKYQTTVLIPKTDVKTVEELKKALLVAYRYGEDKFCGDDRVLHFGEQGCPVHDGDLEAAGRRGFNGCWYVSAKSVYAPKVCDAKRKLLYDYQRVYSGVYCRARFHFYPYSTEDKAGIACSLDGVQILRDGDRIGEEYALKKLFPGEETEEAEDEKKPFLKE